MGSLFAAHYCVLCGTNTIIHVTWQGQGSGRNSILRFVPAVEILHSNQIAEHTITT